MHEHNEIQQLQKLLLSQQRELVKMKQTGNAAAAVVELDQTRIGRLSRMDALQGQTMSQERERRRDIQLQKIAVALKRIEQGNFGYCTECGDEIALKRLQFDPAASLCFNCADDKD